MLKLKKLYYYIFLGSLVSWTLPAHANVIQYFFGSNYKNPAELGTVPRVEASVGVTGVNPNMEFRGVSAGGSGTANTNQYDYLPYFYGGVRLSPDWVVGLNISHPYYGDQRYPEGSIVGLDSTQTILSDVEINPQVSYRVAKNLMIGAGYNFDDYYRTEVNFYVPGIGNIANKSSGWYHGWDVGLFYILTPQDFISLSYFSKLSATTQTGTSTSSNMVSTNYQLQGAYSPATTILNYIHIFNPQWSTSIKLRYSEWNVVQNMVLNNVVAYGRVTLPLHYRNTYSAEVGARYAFRPDWAVLGGVGFDEGASNGFTRSVNFPNDDAYAAAFGVEHEFCKDLSANLVYTYILANTHVNHPMNISQSVGDIDVYANVVDLNLTYKI